LDLSGQENFHVSAVIGRTSLPGWIAVEAQHLGDVRRLCEGINFIYRMNITPIEAEENIHYLTEPHSYEPTTGSLVRLCRHPYQGDLAIVADVDPLSLTTTVRLKPRIDLSPGVA
jgi:hypothetical protein